MSGRYRLSLPVLRSLESSDQSPILVDKLSSKLWLSRLEKFARYFQDEMGTSSPGFRASEVNEYGANLHPFEAHMFFECAKDLLVEDEPTPHRVVGAACFRHLHWEPGEANWGLAWVWLHPFARKHGHLSRAWPLFHGRYGDFPSSKSISRDMTAFLAKHDTRIVDIY